MVASRAPRTIPILIAVCLLNLPALAQYSGGSGTADDPYQIATAEDLMLLGETPEDYDKHFILTADIDLDPNLPGRKVFDRAVIAADTMDARFIFVGTPFTGVFDGNDHTISDLTIHGRRSLGLFGKLEAQAEVRNLGLLRLNITGSTYVGGLVGENDGRITTSYSTGVLTGSECGGLVGRNWHLGRIDTSYSTAAVTGGGGKYFGGLVGRNLGNITTSYSTGAVSGSWSVGGLVGGGGGSIVNSYSTGTASGTGGGPVPVWGGVGGLVGDNHNAAIISNCYSTGVVTVEGGPIGGVGGLLGAYNSGVGEGGPATRGHISASFWDIQTSGQTESYGGTGLSAAEMQTANTFLDAGWDFVDETMNGPNDVWKIVEGQTYPLLSWQKYGGGMGEPNNPYLIYTAEHLNDLGAEPNDYDKYFKLMADIDLSAYTYDRAVIAADTNDATSSFEGAPFTGIFDGNDHTISHLTIDGGSYIGLFGSLIGECNLGLFDGLVLGGLIKDLGIVDVNVSGSGTNVGGLVGHNGFESRGWDPFPFAHVVVQNCFCTGMITGNNCVGGLVGSNNFYGRISKSYFAGTVTGYHSGGLVGLNCGHIEACYSRGNVFGGNRMYSSAAGLVAVNRIRTGYGWSYINGTITNCYSTVKVIEGDGITYGGGLVGTPDGWPNPEGITNCFWDIETSGLTYSEGGIGLTTAEMQTSATFLEAGWDFVDETANGTDDIWWILEGQDYPRLWWER
jgi:hypothetical protein